MISFIPDWRKVLEQAWSVRLAFLAATFSAAEVALPFFTPFFPPKTMAVMAVLASTGAVIARIWAQPAMHKESNK